MGVRHWLKERMAGSATGGDVPPGTSLMNTLLGREEERIRSLGEYDARSYPAELAELLRRRQQVSDEVLAIDVADPRARIEAIPRLRELLRVYPHPLVYELLIHGYVDADRFEEARGVAFAAQARRDECWRAREPEIRAEIEHLKEWTPDEVDRLREERRGGG